MCDREEIDLPDKITYKGYEIKPCPERLADERGWTLDVHILKHNPDGIRERSFLAGNIFETKAEAVKNCFIFAEQIIDRKHDDLSVEDM